jgi:hypothetical protein
MFDYIFDSELASHRSSTTQPVAIPPLDLDVSTQSSVHQHKHALQHRRSESTPRARQTYVINILIPLY